MHAALRGSHAVRVSRTVISFRTGAVKSVVCTLTLYFYFRFCAVYFTSKIAALLILDAVLITIAENIDIAITFEAIWWAQSWL